LIAPSACHFIDVGANSGEWTEMFASKMAIPSGDAFEPYPPTFELLTTRLRSLQQAKIQCHRLALGSAPGFAEFYSDGAGDETASLVRGMQSEKRDTCLVEITTLDAFLVRREGIVDMVKIDAEGFDLKVLLGASQLFSEGRIGVVQFEYNASWRDAGATLSAAVGFLQAHNYSTFILKGAGIYSFAPATLGEYFRYTNLIAFQPEHRILCEIPKLEIQ
jgi:FkbM family methyltransferase